MCAKTHGTNPRTGQHRRRGSMHFFVVSLLTTSVSGHASHGMSKPFWLDNGYVGDHRDSKAYAGSNATQITCKTKVVKWASRAVRGCWYDIRSCCARQWLRVDVHVADDLKTRRKMTLSRQGVGFMARFHAAL